MPNTQKPLTPHTTLIFKMTLDAERDNRHENGPSIAAALNANGLQTSYGTHYSGGRGTYRVVRRAYHEINDRFGEDAASVIAERVVKPNGDHAWK